MIRMALHRHTSIEVLAVMGEWLKEYNGYVGEGDFYFTDNTSIKFYPIAFMCSEEDAIAFKLRFGI